MIEWRAPDIILPIQILQLVRVIRDALDSVVDRGLKIDGYGKATADLGLDPDCDPITFSAFDRLRHYVRIAMNAGLNAPAVRQYLRSMGFDPTEYQPIVREFEYIPYISQSHAKRLRLEYVDRLERGVKTIHSRTDIGRNDDNSIENQRHISRAWGKTV